MNMGVSQTKWGSTMRAVRARPHCACTSKLRAGEAEEGSGVAEDISRVASAASRQPPKVSVQISNLLRQKMSRLQSYRRTRCAMIRLNVDARK
jgi:uncharacterized protein YjiS (DUF1127 family)